MIKNRWWETQVVVYGLQGQYGLVSSEKQVVLSEENRYTDFPNTNEM